VLIPHGSTLKSLKNVNAVRLQLKAGVQSREDMVRIRDEAQMNIPASYSSLEQVKLKTLELMTKKKPA
jgi:capsid protein